MPEYYVNNIAQTNGDHEVHRSSCEWLDRARDVSYLGIYSSCLPAVLDAKKIYAKANGCAWCCRACHTS